MGQEKLRFVGSLVLFERRVRRPRNSVAARRILRKEPTGKCGKRFCLGIPARF